MLAILNNTKIITRIFAVLLLLSAATLGVGLLARHIVDVSDDITDQMESVAHRAISGAQMNAAVQKTIADSRGIAAATTADEVRILTGALSADVEAIGRGMTDWRSVVPADRIEAFNELNRMVDAFVATRRDLLQLAGGQDRSRIVAFVNSPDIGKQRDALVDRLEKSSAMNRKAVSDLNASTGMFYEQQRWILLAVVAAAIVISLLIAAFIAIGTITRPIGRMTAAMRTLADGDTGVEVFGAQRKDEIGVMAKTVQVFKDSMIARAKAEADIAEQRRVAEEQRTAREARERKAIEEISALCDKVSGGDLDTRLNEADKEGFLLTISQQLNTLTGMLQQITGELATVTGGMAHGDLTNAVRGSYRGVFGTLKGSVNAMADKLRDFAGRLNESAATVSSAAAEISTGSQDLAQRTESQAASIEETAASMHEITTTVKQNADNAQAASQLASVARDAADKGGVVMGDAVAAVTRIEESARKIADIVSLIDEIAFQTNLLALNASVEAARAGEAGKGFAVVAQEVRALAQRSANASKDIKALISESNTQVKTGADLVGRTGQSLTEIVGAIKKVSDIVAEIATASREQATGLEQINTAVGSMDEMTQRNGALVEETSASAQSLSGQARQLAELVGFFKTGEARQATAATHKALPRKATVTPLRKPPAKTAAAPVPTLKQTSQPAAEAETDWQEF